MRILQVHNFYQQAGGEDRVVAAEHALLTGHGHDVFQYTVHNNSIAEISAITLAGKTVWNGECHQRIGQLIGEQGIEIIHVHNTLPLISPAVYYAAAAHRVPVVQTLHNYRFLCPAATFYRQGQICELCLTKALKYPAIVHRCYRGSFAASAAVSAMLAIHNTAGTFRRKIHSFIALTEFARKKFQQGGLPAERIVVKPNFLAVDPGLGDGSGAYALFAGRLTGEKGLDILLDSWASRPAALPLRIAGDGPLRQMVRERAARLPNVTYLGPCEPSQVSELLKAAACLILPSRWYEGMPMVLIESMACGTPVVAFGVGSLDDLILHQVNGVKLPFEDTHLLGHLLQDSSELIARLGAMRSGARAYFERHFTAEANYRLLLDIYNKALNQRA